MTVLQAILLGVIQGITEFLPISSSGHLIIFESLFGLKVEELLDFDIALHMGTLLAILIYFRKDIWELLTFKNPKLIKFILIGTIPAVVIGFLFKDAIEAALRSPFSVSILMITVGILFLLPEKIFVKKQTNLNLKKSIIIGLAQSLALMPGVSRSGATILSGTWLGLSREEAARFSFLLGSIAIFGAGILAAKDLDQITIESSILAAGFLASFVAGIFSIGFLMKFLKKYSLKVFGVYRILFGLLIFVWYKYDILSSFVS
jgi:undecaprenyl-diphosphatase